MSQYEEMPALATKTMITELITPVNTDLAGRFLALLARHGASYEKDCSDGCGGAFLSTLSFQPRTQKHVGTPIPTGYSFTLYFPDGVLLHGVTQDAQGEHQDILFVPRK